MSLFSKHCFGNMLILYWLQLWVTSLLRFTVLLPTTSFKSSISIISVRTQAIAIDSKAAGFSIPLKLSPIWVLLRQVAFSDRTAHPWATCWELELKPKPITIMLTWRATKVECKARLNKMTHHLLLLKQWTLTGWEWLQ